MKNKNVQYNKFPTMCYSYANDEQEFVFCVKGRPFPCLVSPHLPTPSSTLLDYNLVRDLGLKMTDLQCQKFVFAGHKMRILGRVSSTVQCIMDGAIFGTSHIKAVVVLDLAKNFDTEYVAGTKMRAQLKGNNNLNTAPSTTEATPTPKSHTSPTQTLSTPPSTPKTPTLRPPPGFPDSPIHSPNPWSSPASCVSSPPPTRVVTVPASPMPKPPILTSSPPQSPWTANINRLESMFDGADLLDDPGAQIGTVQDLHPGGDIDQDHDGSLVYHRVDGPWYQTGHGRYQCSEMRCVTAQSTSYPDNCGFNPAWKFPASFRICSDECSGAFCSCLHFYNWSTKPAAVHCRLLLLSCITLRNKFRFHLTLALL